MRLDEIEKRLGTSEVIGPLEVRKAVGSLRKMLGDGAPTPPDKRKRATAALEALAGLPGWFPPGEKQNRPRDTRSAVDTGMEGLISRQRNTLYREARAWRGETPWHVTVESTERPRMLALLDLEAGGAFEIISREFFYVAHGRPDPATGKRPRRQRIVARYIEEPEDEPEAPPVPEFRHATRADLEAVRGEVWPEDDEDEGRI